MRDPMVPAGDEILRHLSRAGAEKHVPGLFLVARNQPSLSSLLTTIISQLPA